MSPVAKYWDGAAWVSLNGLPVYEQPGQPSEPVPQGSVWIDTDAVTPAVKQPLVTALPASPSDGDEVLYRFAQTTVPVNPEVRLWHLRYDAAAPGTYKWLPVGAQEPVAAFDSPERTQAFGVGWSQYTQVLGATPPLLGAYRMAFGAGRILSSSATVNLWTGLWVNGVWPGPPGHGSAGSGATATYSTAAALFRATLTGFTAVYWGCYPSANSTIVAANRYVELYPVAVGL